MKWNLNHCTTLRGFKEPCSWRICRASKKNDSFTSKKKKSNRNTRITEMLIALAFCFVRHHQPKNHISAWRYFTMRALAEIIKNDPKNCLLCPFSQHFVGCKFHCFLFSQLFSPFVFVGLSNSNKGKWSILKTGKYDLTPQKWAWGSRSGNSIRDGLFPSELQTAVWFFSRPWLRSERWAAWFGTCLCQAWRGPAGRVGSSVPQKHWHLNPAELLPNFCLGSRAQDLAHFQLPECKVGPVWPCLLRRTSQGVSADVLLF